jgi:hypothetical protein
VPINSSQRAPHPALKAAIERGKKASVRTIAARRRQSVMAKAHCEQCGNSLTRSGALTIAENGKTFYLHQSCLAVRRQAIARQRGFDVDAGFRSTGLRRTVRQ